MGKSNNLVLIMLLTMTMCSCGRGQGSLEAKHESSLIEAASANVGTFTQVEIVNRDDYNYCVIPRSSGNVWIMLNPKFEPFYKQMPNGQYSISKQDFKKIQGSGLASSTVLRCLESHIEEK